MFRKLSIAAALAAVFTFGAASSSVADASAPSESKQAQYKVVYSVNGEWGELSKLDSSNLVKKAFEILHNKEGMKIDLNQFKQIEKEAKTPAKKAEQPVKQEKAPAEKVKQPAEKAEAPAEKKAETQKEPAAQPKQKAEAPKQEAQPQPQTQQPAEQPKQAQQSNELSQFEKEVVEFTNQERTKQGLQPLQIDNELSKVAREKSRDMAASGYFDHNSPNYGSPFDMMKSFGIDYRTAGENIAKGQRTPQEVVNAWMNSPGHRANILNGNFTHIGVGFVEQGNHWTQMFIGK